MARLEELMAGERIHRAQILQAARLVVAVAILAVPRLCLAQDDRGDDPPKRPTRGQTGGAVGTTGVGTPAPVGTTGVTPGAVGTTGVTPSGTGTNAPPVTATTTPITGLFKEPELLTKGLNYAIEKFDADDQRKQDRLVSRAVEHDHRLGMDLRWARIPAVGAGRKSVLRRVRGGVLAFLQDGADEIRSAGPHETSPPVGCAGDVSELWADQFLRRRTRLARISRPVSVEEHRHGRLRGDQTLDVLDAQRRSRLFVQPQSLLAVRVCSNRACRRLKKSLETFPASR